MEEQKNNNNRQERIADFQQMELRALLPFLITAQRKGKMDEVLNALKAVTNDYPGTNVMFATPVWQGLTQALLGLGLCFRGTTVHTPTATVKGSLLTVLGSGPPPVYRIEFKLASSSTDVSVSPTVIKILNTTTGTDTGPMAVTGISAGWHYVDFTSPVGPPIWGSGDALTVSVGFKARSTRNCYDPSPATGATTVSAGIP